MIRTSLLIATVVATPALADTITMRRTARVDDGGVVLLRDIAALEGDRAIALGDIQVGSLVGDISEITVRDVRDALDEHGVHWGLINLNGREVKVHVAPARTATVLGANEPARIGTSRAAVPERTASTSDLLLRADLRAAIIRHLQRELAVDIDRLQVRFNTDDRAQLGLDSRRHDFEIKTIGSIRSRRVAMSVRTWQGTRYVGETRIVAEPRVRATVAVLRKNVERDEIVSEDDFLIEERWLEPAGGRGPHDPGTIPGRVARKRLRTGDIVGRSDIEAQRLVRRGQMIKVECRSGGIIIELDGLSQSDGALGEVIEVRKPGERVTFQATVTAPGVAIVDHTSARSET